MKNIILFLIFLGTVYYADATPPRPSKNNPRKARLISKNIPTKPIIKSRL